MTSRLSDIATRQRGTRLRDALFACAVALAAILGAAAVGTAADAAAVGTAADASRARTTADATPG